MSDPLMTRDEVAAYLDIPANQVRKAMSRAGIPHVSGWPRDQVENLQRPGKGWRAHRIDPWQQPGQPIPGEVLDRSEVPWNGDPRHQVDVPADPPEETS